MWRRCAGAARRFSVAPWPLRQPPTVAIIGAPQQYGQPFSGAHRGPGLLRDGGLRDVLTELRWHVDDKGDVDMESSEPARSPPPKAASRSSAPGAPGAKHAAAIGAGSKRLFDACVAAHHAGSFVLTLGGDHSVALGSVAAALAARPETRVLWVDAHADVNTPPQSPSGNMHGMPLAFLLGLVDRSQDDTAGDFDWIPAKGLLRPDRLAYVGLRDVDEEERRNLRLLREQGCFVSTMHDVDKSGIGAVMAQALAALGYDADAPAHAWDAASTGAQPPLHLSFDVDACDPLIAPATGTAVRGGLSYREAHYVCEAAAPFLASLDVVEVNCELSDANGAKMTVELANGLIASALGDSIL
ncbi:hypothetical protein M885DRAFT_626047 [Pelagophyceae sp. CCMP2097]|nr:hypothetical protein M885DRAFT_626047 [Pelagophyceae sp. CCMP2097]